MTVAATPKTKDRAAGAGRKYKAPYQRIEADLRLKIRASVWPPGMILPSRRQLAEEYGVSLGTIERAIGELLADGTLNAQDRRGTFVSERAGQSEAQDGLLSDEAFKFSSKDRVAPVSRTGKIGIVCPVQPRANDFEWDISWERHIISAIERTVTAQGMRTRFEGIQVRDDSHNDTDRVIDELLADKVDGIVFVQLKDPEIEIVSRRLSPDVADAPPAIFVLGNERLVVGTSIYYDNRDAGYRAALHLLDQGCQRIQFFSSFVSEFGSRRVDGVREALSRAGLPSSSLVEVIRQSLIGSEVNAESVEKGLKWFDHKISGYAWAKEVLAAGLPLDGVVAVNDEVATGFIQAAREIGLVAGEDYAIIGFDDMPIARREGITSMRPPLDPMGQEAGRMITQAVGQKPIGQRICLHSQLVARQSSHKRRGPALDRAISTE
ncbi:MAG: substrate-binding domain-containing protein [Capsulimonadaceae bacterium]|nr:substrate-binding domain-containing protein [Capsulimonadaceae bacterium]